MNGMQMTILQIFKEVVSVCDALGLRYYAIGGTAIGAVRHCGFIPWDDDLDIAMPIEDFLRFSQEAEKYLPEYLALRSFEDTPHNQNVFLKVVDTRTTNIEPIEIGYPDSYKGVYIDVMPLSGVPSGLARYPFIGKILLYGCLLYALPWKIGDRSSLKHRALWLLSLPVRPFVKSQAILKRWQNLLAANPYDSASFVGYTWVPGIYKTKRFVFPAEYFEDFVLVPFEDTAIRLPKGYHEYLSQQFGDYMQLPPEDQRETHNGFVDLDNSYLEYQRGNLIVPHNGE